MESQKITSNLMNKKEDGREVPREVDKKAYRRMIGGFPETCRISTVNLPEIDRRRGGGESTGACPNNTTNQLK